MNVDPPAVVTPINGECWDASAVRHSFSSSWQRQSVEITSSCEVASESGVILVTVLHK